MTLECRKKQFGFGYSTQSWPRTKHHIVKIGAREVRLIVENGEAVGRLQTLAVIFSGFILMR